MILPNSLPEDLKQLSGRETMSWMRDHVMKNHDYIRKRLLHEPRGYPCQNANICFLSNNPNADFGFVILEQGKIYPMMSGHNLICVVTALLETGTIPMNEKGTTRFNIEAPIGIIDVTAKCSNGRVLEVEFENQPAWLEKKDVQIDLTAHGLGLISGVDIVWSGMFYAIVPPDETKRLNLELKPKDGREICKIGEMIKQAAKEQSPVWHPKYDYFGPDILCFRSEDVSSEYSHARNAVVMSNGKLSWTDPKSWTGMLDRSPCGTGTCAVMVSLYHRGKLGLNEEFVHESVLGTTFRGRLIEEKDVFGRKAVVPSIAGRAHITQYCKVIGALDDPFRNGYTVGDIWSSSVEN